MYAIGANGPVVVTKFWMVSFEICLPAKYKITALNKNIKNPIWYSFLTFISQLYNFQMYLEVKFAKIYIRLDMTNKERDDLRAKYKITEKDEAPYVMPEEKDYQILAKVKELEAKNLSEKDMKLVKLIRSQLLDDWREPLLEKLNKLIDSYK